MKFKKGDAVHYKYAKAKIELYIIGNNMPTWSGQPVYKAIYKPHDDWITNSFLESSLEYHLHSSYLFKLEDIL